MAMTSDRTGAVAATTDENADGQLDRRDDRIAAKRTGAVGATDSARADVADADVGRARVDTGVATQSRPTGRSAAPEAQPAAPAAPASVDQTTVEPVVRGPRPRASLMATLSLILGVVAALAVLTGLLAGPGIGVGLLAALVGLGGVGATSRRHVAGKSDAFLGIGLGLAAIVIGVLALTGSLSWLNGDTDQVVRVHDWFAAHMSWLLP